MTLRLLCGAGLIRTRRHGIGDLPPPLRVRGSRGARVLRDRDDERY
jgi:hypothetical protein